LLLDILNDTEYLTTPMHTQINLDKNIDIDMQIYTGGTYTQHIRIYWTYGIMNVHTYAYIYFV
jgi:hypothetical protein